MGRYGDPSKFDPLPLPTRGSLTHAELLRLHSTKSTKPTAMVPSKLLPGERKGGNGGAVPSQIELIGQIANYPKIQFRGEKNGYFIWVRHIYPLFSVFGVSSFLSPPRSAMRRGAWKCNTGPR